MDRATLDWALEFEARGPWISAFSIDGVRHGGQYDALLDPRIDQCLAQFTDHRRVLELGSLEGGHSLALARRAEQVTGLEGRADNVARAQWIAQSLGYSNVQFHHVDLDRRLPAFLESYDVIFNVGLLYHLAQPWKLLRQLAPMGRQMFLWTHVCSPHRANSRREGYRGQCYRELGPSDPLSGLGMESFWPTEPELIRMLQDAGFHKIEVMVRDDQHVHGPVIQLVCESACWVDVQTAAARESSCETMISAG